MVAQVVGERDKEALDGDKQHQDAQGHEGKAHDGAGLEGDLKGRANATDSRLGDAAVGVHSDAHANEAGQDGGTRAQDEGGLTRRNTQDSSKVNTTREKSVKTVEQPRRRTMAKAASFHKLVEAPTATKTMMEKMATKIPTATYSLNKKALAPSAIASTMVAIFSTLDSCESPDASCWWLPNKGSLAGRN